MKWILITALSLTLLGCGGGGKQVTRLDANSQTDLSGKWNDTDSRLVAQEMISDCLSRPWLTEFNRTKGQKPVVTVGTIDNMSHEHIVTETFIADFERELVNSAQVRFVAASNWRAELRKERQEQQEFASPETMKKMRNELGADFMLQGTINSIVDQEEGKQVVFYQTDLTLVNIETMEKVWLGQKKIKKGISQGKTSW